jgi:hypothetical protein
MEQIEVKPKYQSSIPASLTRRNAIYEILAFCGVPVMAGSLSRIAQGILQALKFARDNGWKYDPELDD